MHLPLRCLDEVEKCYHSPSGEWMRCRGELVVQDYIPRNFYLSFGFQCDSTHIYPLKGLTYHISFSDQSNDTNDCIDYSVIKTPEKCKSFYHKTSLPNLIGDKLPNRRKSRLFEVLSVSEGTCYKHFWEVACHIMLPKCDPVTKQVVHPLQRDVLGSS